MATHRMAAWQEQVIAKAEFLAHECVRLAAARRADDGPVHDATDDRLEAARRADYDVVHHATNERLEAARRAAGVDGNGQPDGRSGRQGRIAKAWTGAPIEGAFVNLHLAEIVLVQLYGEEEIRARSPGVLARMQHCLAPTDRRRLQAEATFGAYDVGAPDAGARDGTTTVMPRAPLEAAAVANCIPTSGELRPRRDAFREAMKVSYEAADEQHARVRNLRNVLLVAAAVLAALVGLLCLVGVLAPAAIPLCFTKSSGGACPSSNTGNPHPLDIPIVALMGMVGGALSATLAIQRLRTTAMPTPYAIPVSLALLKLPAGALTAIGGMLLIHGEFIPGLSNLDSQGQVLSYAIVLGVAQQVVTRFVDQRAETVLAAVPSKARLPASSGQPARTVTPAPPVP
jgi:hypothetical protein